MTVTIVNLALCVVILGLGCWAFARNKDLAPLLIGIAFGLFGVSHLMRILGLAASLEVLLIVVRVAAYLLVAFATYRLLTRS